MKFGSGRAYALAAFALWAGSAAAQSIGWRAPTYGSQAAIAGLSSQSLAFDASGGVFTFELIADSALHGARLKHFDSAGNLMWSVDRPTEIYPPYGIWDLTALTTVGDDAVVSTLGYDSDYRGIVARFRGSDGALLWQQTDPLANGTAYAAIGTDADGDVLAVGTSVNWPSEGPHGHVAKFGPDGTPLWQTDIPASDCNAAPSTLVFSGVATDSNGDVLAGGAPLGDKTINACAVKLAGDTGALLHAGSYSAPENLQSQQSLVRSDRNGNLLVLTQYFASTPTSWPVSLVRFDAASVTPTWAIDTLMLDNQYVGAPDFAADADGNAIVSEVATQSFGAADGKPRWVTEAAVGGTIVTAPDGSLLVGSDHASDSQVTTGRHFTYTALDPADGSVRWSYDQPIDTFEYWDGRPLLATDANGHFAALQSQSELCCTRQTLLDYGNMSGGAPNWTYSDPDAGPGAGMLDTSGYSGQTRSSVATGDGAVISSGSTVLWYANDYDYSGQLLTTKRAQSDGHLIWSQQTAIATGFCMRGGIALDGNQQDVIVAGTCDTTTAVVKYRGSDGGVLWQASPLDTCASFRIDAVAVDAANDVYVGGVCQFANGTDLLTLKLAGASGNVLWLQHSPGTDRGGNMHPDPVPMRLALVPGHVFVAADEAIDSSYLTMRVRVAALRDSDGHSDWNVALSPPGDTVASHVIDTLTALPSGDVVASIGGSALRLDGATGNVDWSINAVPANDVATTLDNAGDIVLIGVGDIWKLSAADGRMLWHRSALQTPYPVAGLNDIALTPAGNLLVTGTASVPQGQHFLAALYVAQLDAASGQVQWSTTDTSGIESYGAGVLPAADGAVIATANGYVETGAPWWTVRVVTPQAERIFSNSFEL
jgi:hypothetical protein